MKEEQFMVLWMIDGIKLTEHDMIEKDCTQNDDGGRTY